MNRDDLVDRLTTAAQEFLGASVVAALPTLVDDAVANGAVPELTEGGGAVSLRWPVGDRLVPVILVYVNEYASVELNAPRLGDTARLADQAERALRRAMPQKGGTLGQRPNFDISALALRDTQVALCEVFETIYLEGSTLNAPEDTPTVTTPGVNVVRQAFFQEVLTELRNRRGIRVPKPADGNWSSFGFGPFGNWVISVASPERLRLEAYLDLYDKSLTKQLFDEFQARHGDIESRLGFPLSWERLPDRRASRIAVYRPAPVSSLGAGQERDELRTWSVVGLDALMTELDGPLRARAQELRA